MTGVRSKTGRRVADNVYAQWNQNYYRAVIVDITKKGDYTIKYLKSDNGDLEPQAWKCEERHLEPVENLDLIRDEDGRVVGQKRKNAATGASVASQWQELQLKKERDLALLSKCGPNGVVQRWLSRPGVRDKVLEAIKKRGLEGAITLVESVALDGKEW